jgi:ketosteroid isomerase-like protein
VASANVDLVRSIYDRWERGDFFSSGEWVHPEIDYVIADGPDAGSWSGREGLIAGAKVILRAWEGWRPEAEQYIELDGAIVLVLLRFTGRGKASGLEVGDVFSRGANVWHVRAGLVRKLVLYWDRDRALADLGLTLEPDRPA